MTVPVGGDLEMVDISAYKQAMQAQPGLDFTTQVVLDMQNRLESKIPYCDEQPCNRK